MIKKQINESKVKIRKDDTVVITSGNEKGKKGKVLRVLRKDNRVIVQGINIATKHVKPRKQGQESGIIKVEAPINISKVAYFCDKCGKGVKLGIKIDGDKRTRICKKCATVIK